MVFCCDVSVAEGLTTDPMVFCCDVFVAEGLDGVLLYSLCS